MIRETAPDARLVVDANEAWTPREAVTKSKQLAAFDLAFIEQPVPADDFQGMKFVSDRSPIPIALDESCLTAADVPPLADRCDIVSLKLMKCGGLREALRIIHTARAHGLEVMCGCLTSTNAAIAPACHLTPLLDYADLDGAALLEAGSDPYDGVPITDGRIDIASLERPGTGARPATE